VQDGRKNKKKKKKKRGRGKAGLSCLAGFSPLFRTLALVEGGGGRRKEGEKKEKKKEERKEGRNLVLWRRQFFVDLDTGRHWGGGAGKKGTKEGPSPLPTSLPLNSLGAEKGGRRKKKRKKCSSSLFRLSCDFVFAAGVAKRGKREEKKRRKKRRDNPACSSLSRLLAFGRLTV